MSPVKKYDVRLCRIERAEQIAPGIYDVTVEAGELAKAARPGQFAHIYVPGKTLRRPISICETGSGTLRFVFQAKGEGTRILAASRRESGTEFVRGIAGELSVASSIQ